MTGDDTYVPQEGPYKILPGPCLDKTCYRGANGRWNYIFRDGPCAAEKCKWPKGLAPRKHFTDTPSIPIVDAGRIALEEKLAKKYKND